MLADALCANSIQRGQHIAPAYNCDRDDAQSVHITISIYNVCMMASLRFADCRLILCRLCSLAREHSQLQGSVRFTLVCVAGLSYFWRKAGS